jgi:hypothetical protein
LTILENSLGIQDFRAQNSQGKKNTMKKLQSCLPLIFCNTMPIGRKKGRNSELFEEVQTKITVQGFHSSLQ